METGSVFSQVEFDRFVINHGVVGFFEEPITMKSGRKSNHYVNWRTVADDVWAIDKLTDHVIAFLRAKKITADSFFGVPEGGTKLALLAAYKWAKQDRNYGPGSHPFSMGRGKPKSHGDLKDRYFLGIPRGKTIVVEDTTTTGGSLLGAIDQLREAGIEVSAAVALTNRNERRDDGKTVREALEGKGVSYYAMTDLLDLLPEIVKKTNPSKEISRLVENYFRKYGEREIKLVS